jgi:hypothetical protein
MTRQCCLGFVVLVATAVSTAGMLQAAPGTSEAATDAAVAAMLAGALK